MSSRIRDLADLSGERVLVVTSTGGHLMQAVEWSRRLGLSEQSMIVTFESSQSESVVGSHRHIYLPYVAPRDWRGVMAAYKSVSQILDRGEYSTVMSTGAAVALSGAMASVRRRKPFVYIESVSRFRAPSLTGRILQYVPRTSLFAQHYYSNRRWIDSGTLLDSFRASSKPESSVAFADNLIVFVTLGTIRPYRFDYLVEAVRAALRDGDSVTWQLGSTARSDLPGTVFDQVSAVDFDRLVTEADVVVTHGGVGSILRILQLGKAPLAGARRRSRAEHVDDHQLEVVGALADRDLLSVVTGPLTRGELFSAAAKCVIKVEGDGQ